METFVVWGSGLQYERYQPPFTIVSICWWYLTLPFVLVNDGITYEGTTDPNIRYQSPLLKLPLILGYGATHHN